MTKPARSELEELRGWLPARPELVGEIVIQKDDDGRVTHVLSGSSQALPFRVWTPFTKSLRQTIGAQPAERVMELRVSKGEGDTVRVAVQEPGEEVVLIELDPNDREEQRLLFDEIRRFAKKLGGDFDY